MHLRIFLFYTKLLGKWKAYIFIYIQSLLEFNQTVQQYHSSLAKFCSFLFFIILTVVHLLLSFSQFNFCRLHNLFDVDTIIMKIAFPYHAFTWRVWDPEPLWLSLWLSLSRSHKQRQLGGQLAKPYRPRCMWVFVPLLHNSHSLVSLINF